MAVNRQYPFPQPANDGFKASYQANSLFSNLNPGGGGGTMDGMERIAKLEARADFAEQRLTSIDNKLDRVLEKMGALPTTNGLWGMVATVIGVGIAIAGLTFAVAAYVAQ